MKRELVQDFVSILDDLSVTKWLSLGNGVDLEVSLSHSSAVDVGRATPKSRRGLGLFGSFRKSKTS